MNASPHKNQETLVTPESKGVVSNTLILIVVSLSLVLNVVGIYLMIGANFGITAMNDPLGIKRAFLEVEYDKVGGKSNYELLAQAQLIQFKQSLPQLQEFVKTGGGETGAQPAPAQIESEVLDQEKIQALQSDAAFEGPKDATISVYEYSDMECPFCIKQYHDTKLKEKLVAQYGDTVNFAFKNNKWVDHDGTEPKAIASLCAQKVGGDTAYIAYYNAIMQGSPDQRNVYPVADLPKLAREQKLDMVQWQKCYDNKETADIFAAQTAEAISYNLGGTPGTLIVNNKTGKYAVVEWAYPYESFAEKIDLLMK